MKWLFKEFLLTIDQTLFKSEEFVFDFVLEKEMYVNFKDWIIYFNLLLNSQFWFFEIGVAEQESTTSCFKNFIVNSSSEPHIQFSSVDFHLAKI